MEQGHPEELMLPRTKPTVSFPMSCGASPPATTPFSSTHSSMHSFHKHNSGLTDGLGIYKLIEVDTCPEATSSGMDQSTVDRQQQQSNKNTIRGSSWLRVHREGARELAGKLPEGELLQLCLTKREGEGRPELGGNLNKDLRENHSLVFLWGGGRWCLPPCLGFTVESAPCPCCTSSHAYLPGKSICRGGGWSAALAHLTACASQCLP